MWTEVCPCCGFEAAIFVASSASNLESICPACGYRKWTAEKIPPTAEIETVKKALTKLTPREKELLVEECMETGATLIGNLRRGS